ncbi:MAG: biotin--[acetyl-CoA-carboxylase] ligase [Actinomycetes bacterium]
MTGPDPSTTPATPPALAALLAGPSAWHTLVHEPELASTNDVAAERTAAGVPPGLVVLAERQTAGRGRRGRGWEDGPAGGSLLVSATVPAGDRNTSLLPLAAGVAVADALRRLGAPAVLKWPNDVLLDERKCAGILAERHGDVVVLGMGVDVDWRGVDRDGDAAGWTSVAEHLDADVDRAEVLVHVLRALEAWVRDVPRDPSRLLASYTSRCTTLGRTVRAETAAGAVEGVASAVAPSGALVVETAAGAVEVSSGDVVHLRTA